MEKPSKTTPRQGYLLLFFSLVILMLFIPLWVRSVEREIIVRQDLERWDQYTASEQLMRTHFPMYLNREAQKGLGAFNFDVFPDDFTNLIAGQYPDSEDFQFYYNFSGASVIPVPTRTFNTPGVTPSPFDNIVDKTRSSADCHTYSNPYDENSPTHGAYPTCNFYFDEETNRIQYRKTEGEPTDDIKFYYTVPALGTGDANNEPCQPFKLDLTTTTDPLDHPCNWNRIEANQTVAIPLFIRDPQDPTELIYPDVTTENYLLALRLRFPCTNNKRECDPSERPISETDPAGIDTSLEWENQIEFELDSSKKIFTYSIIDQKTGTVYQPLSNVRADSARDNINNNFEITLNRLRIEIAESQLNSSNLPGSKVFLFDRIKNISNIDLTGLSNDLPIRRSGTGDNRSKTLLFKSLSEPFIDQTYSFFDIIPGPDTLAEENPELYFVLRMEGYPIISEAIQAKYMDSPAALRLKTFEYQLISNKPLGNNRFSIDGAIKHPGFGWQTNSFSYNKKPPKGTVPSDPGTVFSN